MIENMGVDSTTEISKEVNRSVLAEERMQLNVIEWKAS